jgi:hypothetical protein
VSIASTSDEAIQKVERLRSVAFTDVQICDIALCTAFRCFVSRFFDAVGAGPEPAFVDADANFRRAMTVGNLRAIQQLALNRRPDRLDECPLGDMHEVDTSRHFEQLAGEVAAHGRDLRARRVRRERRSRAGAARSNGVVCANFTSPRQYPPWRS